LSPEIGLSSRRFLIANYGVIYRMSNKRFDHMMRHPEDEFLLRLGKLCESPPDFVKEIMPDSRLNMARMI